VVIWHKAKDLNEEVHGVVRPLALRPSPITVLEDQAGKGGQKEIACALFEQIESALLE
jgi:hypothetical protein